MPDESAQKQQWAQNNNEKRHHAQNGFQKKKGFPQRTKDVVGSFARKLPFKGSVFDAPSTSHAYKKKTTV